jgi:mRNA-degrading endonuclease toxin of MazEF toxin-antitoxin module
MPFPKHIKRHEFTYRFKKQWGQLYWFDFGEAPSEQRTFAEVHPALIVSDPTITLPGTVLILPITGAEHKRRGYEFHVDVTTEECPELDKDSIAKVDQIYCVPDQLLPDQYFIGKLRPATMRKIYAKLLKVLGMPNFIKDEPQ